MNTLKPISYNIKVEVLNIKKHTHGYNFKLKINNKIISQSSYFQAKNITELKKIINSQIIYHLKDF